MRWFFKSWRKLQRYARTWSYEKEVLSSISYLRHVAWPAVGTLNLRWAGEHLGRANVTHDQSGNLPGFGFAVGSDEAGQQPTCICLHHNENLPVGQPLGVVLNASVVQGTQHYAEVTHGP